MLQKTKAEVTRCMQHAAAARQLANSIGDPELKADYLAMSKRWESLARSAELADRLNDFTNEIDRRVQRRGGGANTRAE